MKHIKYIYQETELCWVTEQNNLQQTCIVQHLRHVNNNIQFVFRNFQPVIECLTTFIMSLNDSNSTRLKYHI